MQPGKAKFYNPTDKVVEFVVGRMPGSYPDEYSLEPGESMVGYINYESFYRRQGLLPVGVDPKDPGWCAKCKRVTIPTPSADWCKQCSGALMPIPQKEPEQVAEAEKAPHEDLEGSPEAVTMTGDLHKAKKGQLAAMARDAGLQGWEEMSRNELFKAVKEHMSGAD